MGWRFVVIASDDLYRSVPDNPDDAENMCKQFVGALKARGHTIANLEFGISKDVDVDSP